MSDWTHVNGSIRIGGKIDRSWFRTCSYYGTADDWEACNVPKGLDESLSVNIWESPDKDDERSTLNFFGDLRHFPNTNLIIFWVAYIINDYKLYVRDGVITINEDVYRYDDNKRIFVLV